MADATPGAQINAMPPRTVRFEAMERHCTWKARNEDRVQWRRICRMLNPRDVAKM